MKKISQLSSRALLIIGFMVPSVGWSDIPNCLAGFCLGDTLSGEEAGLAFFDQDSLDCPEYSRYSKTDGSRSIYISVAAHSGSIMTISDSNTVDKSSSLPSDQKWGEFLDEQYGRVDVHNAWRWSSSWHWSADNGSSLTIKVYFSDREFSFNKFPGQHRIDRKLIDNLMALDAMAESKRCKAGNLLPD